MVPRMTRKLLATRKSRGNQREILLDLRKNNKRDKKLLTSSIVPQADDKSP